MTSEFKDPSPEIVMTATREGFSALSRLLEETDSLSAALDAANKAAGEFYWKQKDLGRAVLCSVTAIAVGMIRTQSGNVDVRSKVKAICYNLASFTWKGWDEPGIVIEPWQAELGYCAAKFNLQLAEELEKDALAKSRAHWMVGAHELARGDDASASKSFEVAAALAKLTHNRAEELLCLGFVQLSQNLGRKEFALAEPDAILLELKHCDDGEFFAQQIETAHRVFKRLA